MINSLHSLDLYFFFYKKSNRIFLVTSYVPLISTLHAYYCPSLQQKMQSSEIQREK